MDNCSLRSPPTATGVSGSRLNGKSAAVAHRARDYLYAHMDENVGLSDLARETGTQTASR